MNKKEIDSAEYVTLWTVQTKQVLDTLAENGIYYVKNHYISEKYGETAWIFYEAYRFFAKKASPIVDRPEAACFPVWTFYDKKWAVPEKDTYRMELKIPREAIISFDMRLWSKVLNLSYMGTEEQEKEFEIKIKRMGITDYLNVFQTPYYPLLKAEVIKSWEQLFREECREVQYMQGAVWMIKKEWVVYHL